jgi:hypothetical protein
MKKITLSSEAQGLLWFCIAGITFGTLLAVVLSFISNLFNAVVWGV